MSQQAGSAKRVHAHTMPLHRRRAALNGRSNRTRILASKQNSTDLLSSLVRASAAAANFDWQQTREVSVGVDQLHLCRVAEPMYLDMVEAPNPDPGKAFESSGETCRFTRVTARARRQRAAKASRLSRRLAVFALGAAASTAPSTASAAQKHSAPSDDTAASGAKAPKSGPAGPRGGVGSDWPRPSLERVHNIQARMDLGRAHSYGVGYGLAWWWDRTAFHPSVAWLGLGVDAALAGRDFPEATAWRSAAVLQAGHLGMGGLTLEVAAGPGNAFDGGSLRWMAQFTALVGFYYVECGYSYATPVDGDSRPSWLSAHSFVLRLRLPVVTTRVRYLDER